MTGVQTCALPISLLGSGVLINQGVISNTANLKFTGGTVVSSGTNYLVGSSFSFSKYTNSTVQSRIEISGNATLSGSTLVNFGVLAASSGGTLTFVDLTFSNALTSGSAGSFIVGNGGTLWFQGSSFYNESSNNVSATGFNLGGGSTLLFTNSAGTSAYTFTLAGADLSNNIKRTNDNFFVSEFVLAGGNLTLASATGTNAAQTKALYVGDLTLATGTALDLGGRTIYFAGTTNILGSFSNGSIIQLAAFTNFLFNVTSAQTRAFGSTPGAVNANWSDGTTPLTDDAAAITGNVASATGTVTFSGGATVGSLLASNVGAGALLLDVGANLVTASGSTVIGTNTTVRIGATTLSGTLSTGNLFLRDNAVIHLTNASGNAANSILVAARSAIPPTHSLPPQAVAVSA